MQRTDAILTSLRIREKKALILNITKNNFIRIVENEFLDLPRRWDGYDFYRTVDSLFQEYLTLLNHYMKGNDVKKVRTICNGILECIDQYHRGFPDKAFKKIETVMSKLISHPLTIYRKSGLTDSFNNNDPLKLFRIRNVQININYSRKDIFHTPYNLRSKVSTCRYSISGYPSLYLGTSLELCRQEAKIGSFDDLTITSRYKIERNMLYNDGIVIDVLELGLKPKDFLNNGFTGNVSISELHNEYRRRRFNEIDLDDIEVMSKYLYWYPLVAACSFIRANKSDPFASEYIVPQLLMQWVRSQIQKDKLFGIRYFSCASIRASELGFNYVFPVSGEKYVDDERYCKILANSFKLTMPCYLHEFDSINDCEIFLSNRTDMDFERI